MSTVRTSRDFTLTAFVRVKDVMRALGCSRSLAYELLRRAAKRAPGSRGLLRVPVWAWERFVLEQYSARADTSKMIGAARTRPSGAISKSASLGRTAEAPQIRITQPRTPARRSQP